MTAMGRDSKIKELCWKEECYLWPYKQIHPGKEVVVQDPEELHQGYGLSTASKLLLNIERRKEANYG